MKDNNFDTELDKIIRASMELKDEPAPELDKKLKAAVCRGEAALKKQSSTRDIPLWYLPMILNLVTFSMLGLAAFMLISNMYLSCIAAGICLYMALAGVVLTIAGIRKTNMKEAVTIRIEKRGALA